MQYSFASLARRGGGDMTLLVVRNREAYRGAWFGKIVIVQDARKELTDWMKALFPG